MKILGFEFGRQKEKSGVALSIPMARGVSYLLGGIAESFSGAWQRHITVESNERILAFSAVNSCISLITDDISKLRIKLMRQRGGIWEEVTSGHPALAVLRRPNHYMSRGQFLAFWVKSILMHGNAYIVVGHNAKREVDSLYPVDPRTVQPRVAPSGDYFYAIGGDSLSLVPENAPLFNAGDVIHDRMNCLWHPLVGTSPIYACANSATHGIRIQNNASSFFENMSRPSGHLNYVGEVNEEQLKLVKQQFESGYSGANVGRLLVTAGDVKFTQMQIPAHDAQLIEQLKWTVEDVARAFHVPSYKLNIGTPTITNTTQLQLEYYSTTLQSRIESIEELLGIALGLGPDMKIELDLDGLIRMDQSSQVATLKEAVGAAIMSPNEARARLNLPPVDGGEYPLAQQQNWSLASLAQRPAPTDPAPGGPTKGGGYSYTARNTDGDTETIYFRTKSEMQAFMAAHDLAERKQRELSGRIITK